MEAVVALSRCAKSGKLFGVRFERKLNPEPGKDGWVYTWSFPVESKRARREKYDEVKIEGCLYKGSEYPGCPFCETSSFIVCGCGKLSCGARDAGETFTCGWCQRSAKIVIEERFAITSGSDF